MLWLCLQCRPDVLVVRPELRDKHNVEHLRAQVCPQLLQELSQLCLANKGSAICPLSHSCGA